MRARAWLNVTACAALVGCAPEFPDDAALIVAPRVLAVKSEPAEAPPGSSVGLSALIADPDPQAHPPIPAWSFCTAPTPPTENDAVSSSCLDSAALLDVGRGDAIQAQTPFEGCSLFGPDTPPGGFRPRDPDITGGYYQPLRLDLAGAAPVFHLERILCALGDAPADIATQFGASYQPNQNPHLLPVVGHWGARVVQFDAIPSGTAIELSASWLAADAEQYTYFDRTEQALVTKRESMQVAWYVNRGQLDTESTGVAENDPALSTSNTYTASQDPGTAKLWVVLRDARGGVDFASYELTILP